MGALKWVCCASESCRSYVSRASHLQWVSDRGVPRESPRLPYRAQLLQGNPFGSAPGHRAGQVGLPLLLHLPQEETIDLETMGVKWFCTIFLGLLSSWPQPFFKWIFFRGRNHSFSLTTGTNSFQQHSYKNLPFYLQFPHHNPKEYSRSFLWCCAFRGSNLGHARKSKWQKSCCKVLGRCFGQADN